MKLKNILILVRNVEVSRKFYKEMFGLDVVLNSDGNVILTEGLVLQDINIWKEHMGTDVLTKNNAFELYFEERNLEAFCERLKQLYPEVTYITKLTELSNKQKVVRFYDPDGHLIEVREVV